MTRSITPKQACGEPPGSEYSNGFEPLRFRFWQFLPIDVHDQANAAVSLFTRDGLVSKIEPFTQARRRVASDLRWASFRQAGRQCRWSGRLGMKVCSQPGHRMPPESVRPLSGARSGDVPGRNAGIGDWRPHAATTWSAIGIDGCVPTI